ncbi:MAG: M3 family metallopeptidase [Bacteroidota bacterium]
MKKHLFILTIALAFLACEQEENTKPIGNPIFRTEFNTPVRFGEITAKDIQAAYDSTKSQLATYIDGIIKVPADEKTFDNTMGMLDEMYDEIGSRYSIIYLMGSTHPDSTIRETAIQVGTDFAKMYNELSLNEDLYKAVKSYSETDEGKSLTGFKLKYLTEAIIGYERNGFALDIEKREELKEILNEITQLSNQFLANIASYEDFLILSEEEMEGMPDDFKESHRQGDGTYKVGLSYPDYNPFMKNANSSKARKKLEFKFLNKSSDKNLLILKDILVKRGEMAELLGYPTFAAYQTETRMAKNPQTVWDFEAKLVKSVMPKAEMDTKELVEFQKSLGIDKDKVSSADKYYLEEKLKAANYGVDGEEIRQYFPIENVKEGLFSITQKLFGLNYKKVKDPSVWHPDVELFEVFDQGELIGRFYLDLHPRPNKYNHAACFPLQSSMDTEKGYQLPEATLVCNFTEPTEDKPALMTHDEVETFFHEFGHVLHNFLSRTTLSGQAGTSVARDFVEAPSQIFENWVWNFESLSLFAKHYKTGEVLPKELFDKMLSAKNVLSGNLALQQILYGTYDITLHDKFDPNGDISTTDLYKKLQNEITPYDYVPGTHFEAGFGHLMGYSASYYGYKWSEVYAQDMFSRFEEKGILNPEVGAEYRNKILARGSEVDEMQMLKDFLGREPNDKAFVKSLGLDN